MCYNPDLAIRGMGIQADQIGKCIQRLLVLLLATAALARELAANQMQQQQQSLHPTLLQDCLNQGFSQQLTTFNDFASKKPAR